MPMLKASLMFALSLVTAFSTLGQATPDHNAGWRLFAKSEGVEIFRREVPGSSIIALKGKGVIEAPLWKLAAILLDTERAPEWVDSLGESRMVRRLSPYSYIEYNHIRTPFIMRDREFVSLVQIEVDPKGKRFALHYRPLEGSAEVAPSSKVRGQIVSGAFVLGALSERTTLLDAELHCDPMGSVPKWIINFFQSDWPKDTFQALRIQSTKPDIRIPSDFGSILQATVDF